MFRPDLPTPTAVLIVTDERQVSVLCVADGIVTDERDL
jgi:hypothetical protein